MRGSRVGVLLAALLVVLGLIAPGVLPAATAADDRTTTADAMSTTAEPAATGSAWSRIGGEDRYAVTVNISRYRYADPSTVRSVYLARGDVFADALTAGSLSDGPVLLVTDSCRSVPSVVLTEIARLDPDRVVALGGEQSVCADQLAQAAAGHHRVGRDRAVGQVDRRRPGGEGRPGDAPGRLEAVVPPDPIGRPTVRRLGQLVGAHGDLAAEGHHPVGIEPVDLAADDGRHRSAPRGHQQHRSVAQRPRGQSVREDVPPREVDRADGGRVVVAVARDVRRDAVAVLPPDARPRRTGRPRRGSGGGAELLCGGRTGHENPWHRQTQHQQHGQHEAHP